MLHVTTYPSEPVWGLLLGKDSSTVTAIAPLFHSDLVATTLETSLMVVDQLLNNTASKWNGLKIIGCYVANRLIQSNSINSVTAKFGHAIRKDNNGQGCIIVIDNKLGSLKQYSSGKDGSWEMKSTVAVSQEGKTMLSQSLQINAVIHDFDDHLDDVSISFGM